MKGFLSAIQFLTILPIGRRSRFDAAGMIFFFPVVGLLLGAMVALFDHLALVFWPKPAAAVLDTALLILLTGALHVDGLGDTADGLYGNRPRDKALAIMKDSRVGVMGVAAIVMGLSVKWAGIQTLEAHRSLLLTIIPAYARGGMIFGIRFLEYGRPGGGTGHALFSEPLKPTVFLGLAAPVALSVFSGWTGLWLNALFILATAAILSFYKRRIGCITGDMLGAMTEILEALLFLLVAAGGVS